MTLREVYQEAIIWKYHSLQLMIEYLVNERKVLTMKDDESKLSYYLQEKFAKKMNEYLLEYERVRKNV